VVAEWHARESRFGCSDGVRHHKARGGVEPESILVGGIITASGNLSDLAQEGGGLISKFVEKKTD